MRIFLSIAVLLLLHSCKHPLAIEGEGDIVERLVGQRGCTLEEFQANSPRCTENDVVDEDYIVSYEAVPRPGWRFVTWRAGTACGKESVAPYSDYNVAQALVAFMDEEFPDLALPATVAVFGQPNTWTTKADMATARLGLTSCTVNGKIYAIGGYAAANAPGLTTVEEYDPVTNTWSKKADIPTARRWLSVSAANGKCYAFGGHAGFGQPGLQTVEEYDPVLDQWRRRTDMPTARLALASAAIDGKLYVFGGTEAPGFISSALATVEEYDPATDTWTRKADMPTGRMFPAASAVKKLIYVIGGGRSASEGLSVVEMFDPGTNTWQTKNEMPTARLSLAAVAASGRIYAIGGGVAGGSALHSVEEYDPLQDQWTVRANLPVERFGPAASEVGGKIYVIGGAQMVAPPHPGTSSTEEYTPP